MTTNRRGFLIGLSSALAMPAVVQAQNIMPVSLFNPIYTRVLLHYDICFDQFQIRVDKAAFPLKVPPLAYEDTVKLLTIKDAEQYISKETISKMQPTNNQHLACGRPLTNTEYQALRFKHGYKF